MPAEDFAVIAKKHGLQGSVYGNVETAFQAAKNKCNSEDTIFIGGSTFVVADILRNSF
jgi:dihydrofolate synthase/folylpolyglutamate synthase